MSSNVASFGGAVAAGGDSIVIATNCTMILNTAYYEGGAVLADEGSTVTAKSCAMSSNSAVWGGAVSVRGNSSLPAAGCATTLDKCVLTLNTAWSGAALLVHRGGIAYLVNSLFQFNVGNDTDDGVGIMNLHGQVQCDPTIGCLPVCTVCQDEEAPTTMPTYGTIRTQTQESDGSAAPTFALVALSTLCFMIIALWLIWRCVGRPLWRRNFGRDANRPRGEGNEGVEVNLLRLPLLQIGDATAEHNSANEDALTTARSPNAEQLSHTGNRVPLPWSAIGSSPAPIFVINREMRIVSWSQGGWVVVIL
jgi:hypothetical protein